jgi:hypothetical protein
VQGPLYDYLKSLGVTQPIDPELAADIDALVLARVKCRRVARRISFTTFSADSFTGPDFCLVL